MSHDVTSEGSGLPELPDLLGMGLAELSTLEHPVLAEVLAELRARLERPEEMFWAHEQAAPPPTAD